MDKRIQLLDLRAQYASIKNEVDEAVKRVIDAQNFILGKDVESLEKEIAAYCDTKYAVGVASGTDAIKLSLRAAGVGPGDEVITVPFTFMATAGAVSELGAKPVFVDIGLETYTMDPGLIEKSITKKTKAIIPVHLYGQAADIKRIVDIAAKHGIRTIEDCAQSIGATYDSKKTGSFGFAGAISFFPSKNLGAFGDGGMIVTNDEIVGNRLKMLRVHGSGVRYVHSELGYNSRLDNLQAAVLRVKLAHLDSWARARQENAEFYNKNLSKIKGVTIPAIGAHNTHVYHQYVIRVDGSVRDRLVEYLEKSGIEARVYYPIPLHLQACYKDLGYREGDFPNSEKAALGTLALPVYTELSSSQKQRIVDRISEFFQKGI